jgi:hypothetical protein
MCAKQVDLMLRLPKEWFSTMEPDQHWEYLGPISEVLPGRLTRPNPQGVRRPYMHIRPPSKKNPSELVVDYPKRKHSATPRPISYRGETTGLVRALYARLVDPSVAPPLTPDERQLRRYGDPSARRNAWDGLRLTNCPWRFQDNLCGCVNPYHAHLHRQPPRQALPADLPGLLSDWCASNPEAPVSHLQRAYDWYPVPTLQAAARQAALPARWHTIIEALERWDDLPTPPPDALHLPQSIS